MISVFWLKRVRPENVVPCTRHYLRQCIVLYPADSLFFLFQLSYFQIFSPENTFIFKARLLKKSKIFSAIFQLFFFAKFQQKEFAHFFENIYSSKSTIYNLSSYFHLHFEKNVKRFENNKIQMRIFMRFFRGGKYYKKYKITFLKDSLQSCYLCYHLYIRCMNAHLHFSQNVKFKCNNKLLRKKLD